MFNSQQRREFLARDQSPKYDYLRQLDNEVRVKSKKSLGKLFFTILALASGQSLDGMPPFTTGTNLLDTVKQMLAKVNCSPTFRQMIEVVLLQNDYQKWPSFADIRD